MLTKRNLILLSAALFVIVATALTADSKLPGGLNLSVISNEDANPAAQKTTGPPAAPPPTREERIGAGEDYARKLLLLMDTDKDGKVSKKEFMNFMSAEFDRMDTNHDGMLDVKELTGLRVKSYVGK